MLKTSCKYCRKLNMCESPFKNMNIKGSGKLQIKSKCCQCGMDIVFTNRDHSLKIVNNEKDAESND